MADIGHRIQELRKAAGLSREAFAVALDEKPSKIQDVESGRQRVNDEFLRKLIAHFPVDLNWLFDASGFKGRTAVVEPPDYAKPGHGDVRIDGYDCVRIRRMDLSVSAGSGVVAVEGPDAAPLVVPVGWMQRLRVNADLTVLVRVQGDSMAPTVPDGSYVLIHLIEKTVDQPGIYAFTRDGEAFIKRLIPSDLNRDGRPGTIMVLSDNTAYPPYAITGPRLNELRIVGRIRMVLSCL